MPTSDLADRQNHVVALADALGRRAGMDLAYRAGLAAAGDARTVAALQEHCAFGFGVAAREGWRAAGGSADVLPIDWAEGVVLQPADASAYRTAVALLGNAIVNAFGTSIAPAEADAVRRTVERVLWVTFVDVRSLLHQPVPAAAA